MTGGGGDANLASVTAAPLIVMENSSSLCGVEEQCEKVRVSVIVSTRERDTACWRTLS